MRELDAGLAELIEMVSFAGLTIAEIVVLRGVATRTVNRDLPAARALLRGELLANEAVGRSVATAVGLSLTRSQAAGGRARRRAGAPAQAPERPPSSVAHAGRAAGLMTPPDRSLVDAVTRLPGPTGAFRKSEVGSCGSGTGHGSLVSQGMEWNGWE